MGHESRSHEALLQITEMFTAIEEVVKSTDLLALRSMVKALMAAAFMLVKYQVYIHNIMSNRLLS